MSDLQTRLEATLSLATQCKLEASLAAEDVKRKEYSALAVYYESVAEDLRARIAKSAGS
jgi:hypothetical protein